MNFISYHLCKIMRLHKWEYKPAVYKDARMEKLAIPEHHAKRKCKICGVEEFEDKMLLGLNPPAYSIIWRVK